MGWKLEPSRMLSWKKRKSKLNEIMHAKRMFNQRAKRKLEITEKRKPLNVVLLQSVWCRACLCASLEKRGGVTCQYKLNCHFCTSVNICTHNHMYIKVNTCLHLITYVIKYKVCLHICLCHAQKWTYGTYCFYWGRACAGVHLSDNRHSEGSSHNA